MAIARKVADEQQRHTDFRVADSVAGDPRLQVAVSNQPTAATCAHVLACMAGCAVHQGEQR